MRTPPKPAEYLVVFTNADVFRELEAKHGVDGFDPGRSIDAVEAKTLQAARTMGRRLQKSGHYPHHIAQLVGLRLEDHYGDDGQSWHHDDTEIVEEF